MRTKLLAFLLAGATASGVAFADTFKSAVNRFMVVYAAPWKPVSLPDPSGELFLLCDEKVCGPKVLLSFGAYLEPALKASKIADFLAHAKGDSIIQNIRSAPGVARVAILREGRARLGTHESYEVLAEITLQSGQKRLRHTFMTFDAGHIYNVSLGCSPELHANALAKAQTVLASFRIK